MAMTWRPEAAPGVPYWWQALGPPPPSGDALPERCDLLVVGAGYTGLSAALAGHDCGARVAVVEAGVPGEGASTRNGGMLGAHPRLGWEALAQRFGTATADAIFAEAKPALDWVTGLIAREAIACDLQRTGRIQLAWTRAHGAAQARLAARVREKSAVAVRLVPRDGLAREIATARYFGGLVFPEHGAVHPAKFHRGLWQAALARGIPVLGGARVEALDRDGAGFVARTPRGTIRAGKVVLATNGHTAPPFRWHMARVFALPSYIIATEPLPADLIGHLAPGRRMMVETRARHSYFRIAPDGARVLFGGRAAMCDIGLHEAAARLYRTMCEIWPELDGAALSHVWTGNTGYSFGHMPHVGEHRGLHHAIGFSGSGTVMAPWLGAKAAWRAIGDARGQTAYADTRLTRHWLHPTGRPHFLRAADLWYRHVVDRRESRLSR